MSHRSKPGPREVPPGAEAQRAVRRLKRGLASWNRLLDLLVSSRAWKTLGPALRGWMSPATLGRGRTILDELQEERAALEAAVSDLEAELVPAQVLWEASERALACDPDVSVLVTNRDGARSLAVFLESYARHHAAGGAELVILDHASRDDSTEVVRAWMDRLPIQLLRCNRNQRYSVANNVARRYARGQILVFANNDIAFDEEVLPALVAALDDPTVGMAGVELWYPEGQGVRSNRCQHRGIQFSADPNLGFMRPFNVQAQERQSDASSTTARGSETREVPAVTAALAACRADDFDAVGGFIAEYDYGFEDVDLALAIRRQLGKYCVVCPVGALHQEFGTQRHDPDTLLVQRRAANARLLRTRHGAWLARRVTRSQLDSGRRESSPPWHRVPLTVRLPPGWSAGPNTIPPGFQPLAAEEFRDVESFSGVWLVDDPGELAGAPPRGAICVARVAGATTRDWLTAPAFRHVDVLVCERDEDQGSLRRQSCAMLWKADPGAPFNDGLLTDLPDLLDAWMSRPGIALKSATPNEAERDSWGDFHFAEALGRAMRDRGFRVRHDLHPDWSRPGYLPDDVSLVLRGLEASPESLDGVGLVWLISHPERVTNSELERFDQVFVASDRYAELLADRLDAPVCPLLQCTDPTRFPFVEHPNVPARRLFVGNSKGYYRPIVRAALAAGEDVDIWGTWWHEHLDASLIRGEGVPNEELGALYGNSGVVLNDHWPDMARLGFLSNRLFDVAATGALLVTDPVQGVEAVFGEDVLVARDLPEHFPALDERRVADRSSRRRLAETVSREHTFEARAARIADVLAEFGVSPPSQGD